MILHSPRPPLRTWSETRGRSRSIREVLEALEWVRKELMRKGSPDFVRARKCEEGVKDLITKMLR